MTRLNSSSAILHDPIPMGRIGVRMDDREIPMDEREVVLATDFSPFAFLIEEMIASGVTTIAIRASSPDAGVATQMPPLLRRRIKIINTAGEQESIIRLLHRVFKEMSVSADDSTGRLRFPKKMDHGVSETLNRFYGDCQRLAIGFNHSLQVSVQPRLAASAARVLRTRVSDKGARSVLAQLEAVFAAYDSIKFDVPVPSVTAPHQLVSIFDRLVNDSSYVEFSNAVDQLRYATRRRAALARIRGWSRDAVGSAIFSKGWAYLGKVVGVFTRIPIPEKDELVTIVGGRAFPLLVDLKDARSRAVEMWKASGAADPYIGPPKSGKKESFVWLPPMQSCEAGHPDSLRKKIGTAGELLRALQGATDGPGDSKAKRRSRGQRSE